jgi:hypothetical protein
VLSDSIPRSRWKQPGFRCWRWSTSVFMDLVARLCSPAHLARASESGLHFFLRGVHAGLLFDFCQRPVHCSLLSILFGRLLAIARPACLFSCADPLFAARISGAVAWLLAFRASGAQSVAGIFAPPIHWTLSKAAPERMLRISHRHQCLSGQLPSVLAVAFSSSKMI